MKSFAVFVAILGCVAAQKYSATQNGNEIVIVRSENENNGDGTFRWLSELSDGTKLEQSGYVKDGPDPENPIQVIQGAYSYVSPDGQQINLQYTADENGFVPVGEHIPKPHPDVQKAIDEILRNIQSDHSAAGSQNTHHYQQPAQQGRFQQRRF